MTQDIDAALIDRFLAGECSAAETDGIRRAMASDAGLRARVECARVVWGAAQRTESGWDVEGVWQRTRSQLTTDAPRVQHAHRHANPWVIGVVAAAALIAITVLMRSPSRLGERTYATSAGQQLAITLVDGTRITLAPASRLRLAPTYGRSRRDVYLEGEAYFAVQHDAARPFTVRARDVVATDIGTQFDVRAYGDDRAVHVTVAEGRVGLGTGNTTMLVAGDDATVRDTAVAIMHGVDLALYTGWMQGRLIFRDTPLPDVVRQLARTYNLDIRLGDTTLSSQTVTGSLTNATADEALEAVARAVGARVQRDGRRAVLLPGSPADNRSLPAGGPALVGNHS